MNKYEQLKKVIQQANPEIMELKFGCEVSVQNYATIVTIIQDKTGWTDTDGNYPLDFLGYTGGCYLVNFDKTHIEQVLGRPIRLADVLLVAGNKITGDYINGGGFLTFMKAESDEPDEEWEWTLRDDNLDHQSDETKHFLIDLLVTKE